MEYTTENKEHDKLVVALIKAKTDAEEENALINLKKFQKENPEFIWEMQRRRFVTTAEELEIEPNSK